MKYYTPVYFFHITKGRYERPSHVPNNAYRELRALAFVDTENRAELGDVLPAVRAAFSESREDSEPFFAVLTKHGHTWLATGGFHARSAGDWRPHKKLYIFDDLYAEDSTPRVVDLAETFDTCTSLFRMADGCPCPLAKARINDETGGQDYYTYHCGVEFVWPQVRKEPYNSLVAQTLRQSACLPDSVPKHAGEYEFLSRRELLDEPFAHTISTHDELAVPDMESIARYREQLRENAKAAAATRGFRSKECSECPFKKCSAWHTRDCDGHKTLDDIRQYNGTPTVVYPGFTDLQRNVLMRSSANYRALDAYGLNSPHKRAANLGYFTESGAFRVFRSARNFQSEHIDVKSWDALITMIPQIAEWDLTQLSASGISEEALRIYTLISGKRWRNFRSGWGNTTKDLLGIWVRNGYYGASTPQVVSCLYSGYGNRYEFTADGSSERVLFSLLHDDREGSVITSQIG